MVLKRGRGHMQVGMSHAHLSEIIKCATNAHVHVEECSFAVFYI